MWAKWETALPGKELSTKVKRWDDWRWTAWRIALPGSEAREGRKICCETGCDVANFITTLPWEQDRELRDLLKSRQQKWNVSTGTKNLTYGNNEGMRLTDSSEWRSTIKKGQRADNASCFTEMSEFKCSFRAKGLRKPCPSPSKEWLGKLLIPFRNKCVLGTSSGKSGFSSKPALLNRDNSGVRVMISELFSREDAYSHCC